MAGIKTARIRTMALVVGAALLVTLVGGSSMPGAACAQAGCAEQCRAGYGSCYKTTANRAACDAQLQRCMQGCLRTK